jgi:hypothetical protein
VCWPTDGGVACVFYQLETFFNHLCEPTDEPKFGDPPTSIVPRQFKKKAMLVMHQFVQSHAKEIHDELNEFPSYEVKVCPTTHHTRATHMTHTTHDTHTTPDLTACARAVDDDIWG